MELEHGHRRGRHVHALEEVEMHPGVVRDRRLDRVGVAHDDDGLVGMRGHDAVERGNGARLHLADRLAAGKARERWRRPPVSAVPNPKLKG